MKLARLLSFFIVFVSVWSPVANAFGCPMADTILNGLAGAHSLTVRYTYLEPAQSHARDSSVIHARHADAGHLHCQHPCCSNGGHCSYMALLSNAFRPVVGSGTADLLYNIHPSPLSGFPNPPLRPPIS